MWPPCQTLLPGHQNCGPTLSPPVLPTPSSIPIPPPPTTPSPASDIIWWWSLETCSNLFIWGPTSLSSQGQYLVVANETETHAACILRECCLVTDIFYQMTKVLQYHCPKIRALSFKTDVCDLTTEIVDVWRPMRGHFVSFAAMILSIAILLVSAVTRQLSFQSSEIISKILSMIDNSVISYVIVFLPFWYIY